MNKPVRTRFAPSPTGLLHIGGVRTALFAYLFAKSNNGTFILRLEDTDRERFVENGVEQIIKSLDWVGIHPDEGVWYQDKPGNHGPYVQSKRLDHYQSFANQLVDQGLAYYSYISKESFSSYKQDAINNKRPFVYRKNLEIEYHDGAVSIDNSIKYPIRLDIVAIQEKFINQKHPFLHERVDWDDEVRDMFSSGYFEIDDFVIMKADGYPTYNFANVVDDHLMQITHVIRGDEFISTTAKHALLYDVFSWERPKFIHLASILGPDGKKKLSKRDGDVNVLEYKAKGYLPEALINFLALLGWNDGTEQELFSIEELIDKFDIGRIQKSPARFDIGRLNWMNGEYIRTMSYDELLDKLSTFLPKDWYEDREYLKKVLKLDKDRIKTLSEAQYVMEIFFETPKVDQKLLTDKDELNDIRAWLKESSEVLQGCEFEHDKLEQAIRDLTEKLGIKTGQLFYALRIALTGRTEAPGLFDIMLTLGKEETLKRIKMVIK